MFQDVRKMYGSATALIDNDSNGGTDQTLVAAVTNCKIVVDELAVSASAAATFFLESDGSVSDTVIWPTTNMAANTSFVVYDPGIKTLTGEALLWNATITGNISFFVRYHLEQATA